MNSRELELAEAIFGPAKIGKKYGGLVMLVEFGIQPCWCVVEEPVEETAYAINRRRYSPISGEAFNQIVEIFKK